MTLASSAGTSNPERHPIFSDESVINVTKFSDFMQQRARPRISKIMIHIGGNGNGSSEILVWVISPSMRDNPTFGPWAMSSFDDIKIFANEVVKYPLESGLLNRVRLTHKMDRQFSTVEPMQNLFRHILEYILEEKLGSLDEPVEKLLEAGRFEELFEDIPGLYEN